MLTSPREWASMLALCLLLSRMGEGGGDSVTWGHVGKYASPLLTKDVYLTAAAPGRDLVYGSQVRFISRAHDASKLLNLLGNLRQNASDNYRITGIHVEDLGAGAEAHITAGGIGQKFVVLRCQRNQAESTGPPAHLEVAIYGLDLP
ncbi:hypothetical protein KR038_004746 [Drosophila bunnanda]|nr:hypothetical protein KR038_004746 [Drosophila bunnanda]